MQEETEKRKETIKNWLKEPYHLLLAALFAFVIILYLYYFFKLGNQPIWWDEGDYLGIAKALAMGGARPEWWTDFTTIRPLFIPVLWAGLFKIGFGETFIRFSTELLPALASIFLIYLLGKSIFNEKVGLISAFLLSVNWVFMFYSFRLLTDLPALFFAALSLYFFWVKYEKPHLNGINRPLYLWLAVAFGVLAFLTRYIAALTLVIILAYLFVTRKFSPFKDKNMWIALVIGLLVLSPYAIYNFAAKGSVFPALSFYYTGPEATAPHRSIAWNTLTYYIPSFFKYSTIFLALGFLLLLEIFLYFDVIFRQKEKSRNGLLLCFLGIFIPLAYFIFSIRALDPRYFIATAPLMFPALALGIDFISEKASSLLKSKWVYAALIIVILAILGYEQLQAANSFITSSQSSYLQIQQAGLWIKQNSNPADKVITASIIQNQYYSDRYSYDFFPHDAAGIQEWSSCYYKDAQLVQKISSNESCTKITEGLFNKKVSEIKPAYYIISAFEPVFTPQWAYSYPQQYNLTPVKAYGTSDQPILIIYKFPANFNPSLQ